MIDWNENTRTDHCQLDEKDVSKRLLELRVDGLIFDHVAESSKEEYSTGENLFISKWRKSDDDFNCLTF